MNYETQIFCHATALCQKRCDLCSCGYFSGDSLAKCRIENLRVNAVTIFPKVHCFLTSSLYQSRHLENLSSPQQSPLNPQIAQVRHVKLHKLFTALSRGNQRVLLCKQFQILCLNLNRNPMELEKPILR